MEYVLIALLVILAVLAAVILYLYRKNGKIMKDTVSACLEELKKSFKITEKDAGKFSRIKISGIMNFNVKKYETESLGNLCVMTMNMGLMQMVSFILTPMRETCRCCPSTSCTS